MKFFKFTDTAVLGLITGQIIGRWGNFFNREAFGSYTDSLFAMQIPVADIGTNVDVTDAMKVMINGVEYVQVQPTFLYESVLNLVLLILLLIFRDKKKFYGETFCRYLMGYGVIRFIVEGFRTDQLKIGSVAVSQILSAVLFVAALAIVIVMRLRLKGKPSQLDPIPVKKSKRSAVDIDDEAEVEEQAEEEAMEEVSSDIDDDMEETSAQDSTEEDMVTEESEDDEDSDDSEE